MADLLPSLSSDDEANAEQTDDEGDEKMDECFEFGGILGEDGGVSSSFVENVGWSFRPDRGVPERGLPHMDLSALIAAKRKAMISANSSAAKKQNQTSNDETTNKTSDRQNEIHKIHDDSSSSSSSDVDSNDEGDVGDHGDTADKELEGDVLKLRAGKEDDEDSDSEDDDEDEATERAKAAEYFQQEEAPVTDRAFTELALSRPLLRGVAAMGFVQPTPIQSSVIPLALQGRDVCASAQTGSGKVRRIHRTRYNPFALLRDDSL
jgi:ATP-dependent RNA helicase DDX27